MIKTYCAYGLYDEDTGMCYEEGDIVSKITYESEEGTVTIEDAHIDSISENEVEIGTDDEEITIKVDSVCSIDI